MKESNQTFKSGHVAIIGKPNVGKSTILNYFLGEKLAIVSEKPETTRDNILGILSKSEFQIVFFDTPGIHKPKTLLGKHMVKEARNALSDVDLILLVIDATSCIETEDEIILGLLGDAKKPTICAINKVDLVRQKQLLLPLIDELHKAYEFKEIIPISATKTDNMEPLLNKILQYLPQGPAYYPQDQLTDKSQRYCIGEIIREKVLEYTYQEVPHSVAVLVEEVKERPVKPIVYVRATIFVERKSQKLIIIGRNGQMLKKIGETARHDIETFIGQKVYLDLWVKVYPNWRKDPHALKMLGYA